MELRAIERSDLPVLHAMLDDLETESRASAARPTPTSSARLEAVFDERARTKDAAVRFAVTVDGAVVGDCQVHSIDDLSRTCHLGIALLRDHWGKGYGTDAVRTLVGYAFRNLNLRKVCLEVLADDARAVGAYRRAGFVEEGRFLEQTWYDGAYRDVLRMAVRRD